MQLESKNVVEHLVDKATLKKNYSLTLLVLLTVTEDHTPFANSLKDL